MKGKAAITIGASYNQHAILRTNSRVQHTSEVKKREKAKEGGKRKRKVGQASIGGQKFLTTVEDNSGGGSNHQRIRHNIPQKIKAQEVSRKNIRGAIERRESTSMEDEPKVRSKQRNIGEQTISHRDLEPFGGAALGNASTREKGQGRRRRGWG